MRRARWAPRYSPQRETHLAQRRRREPEFVQLRLHGKGEGFSNAAAIGAKVTVVSGGVRQVQEVSGGYGHVGLQHDTMLTFGLGATCAVDAVEVRWPNGEATVQKWSGVVANYVVDLTEGEDQPRYTPTR
jgi:hypothetical protein